MKTLFLKSKFVLLTLSFLTFASCSSDDENSPTIQPPTIQSPTIQSPTISYARTTLDATFFQADNSATPTLNWNGNQGNCSLAIPITGLSVNTTTGVLNWTKGLPIGTHNLEIVVTNSDGGQTSENLTLNNPLQGVFTGDYDSSFFFELEFNSDGTLLTRANDETNPLEGTGTWTKNGATIKIDHTYTSGNEFSLSGTLVIGTSAIYSGDWFHTHGAISGNEGGDFEVILN